MPTSREEELEATIASLRASEAKYRSLFQLIDIGYCVIEMVFDTGGHPVDYIFREANPAFLKQTGLADPVGRSMRGLAPDHEPFWFETYGRIARTGVAERFEHRADALGRWYSVFAFRAGDPGENRVAVLFEDIKQRKLAEQLLRDSEEHQQFLLGLSDALRAETGVEAAGNRAVRMIAERLAADRVYLVTLTPGDDTVIVTHETRRDALPPLRGSYRASDFPAAIREIFERTIVYEDVRTDPRLTELDRQSFAGLAAVGFMAASIRRGGEAMIWAAGAVSTEPRAWTPAEVKLFEAAIERTWAAVERARAEAALREREERLKIALEAGRMGTYRLDLATGEQQWSDEQYEIFGLTKGVDTPSRELFLSLVHPDDHHRITFTPEDIRTPGTYLDSEFRITRPDGEQRWIIAHALALFGPDGRPAELIGVNQDVTEHHRLEAAMHSTEERLNEFSEASSDILWIRRASDYQWEYLSPAFHRIYGISRLDALRGDNYRSWLDLVVPDDRAHALAGIERVMHGERASFEYRVLRPEDGEVRWLRSTDFPMRDETGDVVRIGGIGQDITAMKRAEEHQRVLQLELQHRVRNTLAVIRSITRRTAATTDSKDEFFMHLDGRIDSFARVQAAVARDPTSGVDLAFLVAEELRVIGAQEGHGLSIDGPPVALSSRAAETFGLAIHELATNAMKHGALAHPRGRIEVSFQLDGAEPAMLQFDWRESGLRDLPPKPPRIGFGTEILEQTLAYELGAVTTLDYRPSGLCCRITIPAAAALEARG